MDILLEKKLFDILFLLLIKLVARHLDSGKFSMRVSGEKKIGHPIPKSAVMSETG
jgi:hypothetical protein